MESKEKIKESEDVLKAIDEHIELLKELIELSLSLKNHIIELEEESQKEKGAK